MHRPSFRPSSAARHTLILSLLTASLTGCGGGSSDSTSGDGGSSPRPGGPAPVQVINGVVSLGATALPTGTVVCADRNANLGCDADEERATPDATGGFALGLRTVSATDGLLLVAEIPAHASAEQRPVPVGALVAPASAGVVSGLTTLEWASGAPLATPEARAAWLRTMGFAAGIDPHAITEPGIAHLDEVLAPALADTQVTLAAAASKVDAARQAARAVTEVMARYVDDDSGQLLPTVTSQTLASEARYAVRGNVDCQPPQIVATARLDTEGAAPIVSKEDYLRATLTLTGPDGTTSVLPTQVRGRGNSTWEMPKRPYRLKLDQAAPLLGMAANRDWAVLANYADKTLMRNAVALCMGRMLDFDFTPDSRYIELTLNGDYVGIYQVTDQVEVGRNRVDIDDQARNDTDQDLGFLLEIDAGHYLEEKFWFIGPSQYPYVIKSEITAGQLPLVSDYITRFETALFGDAFLDPQTGYRHYLDTDSAVDFYLVNEALRNSDIFYSSTYLHRQRGGLLRFGPLWDFDLAAGNIIYANNDQPEGWWVRVTSSHMARLIDGDPQFRQHLLTRWAYLQRRMADIQQLISAGAQNLDAAQARNFTRWPILNEIVWPNPVAVGSYAGEVDRLKSWLQTRTSWIGQQYTGGAVTAAERRP